MHHSTSIGIDTHKTKNVVCALVAGTGEVAEATLSSDPETLIAWIRRHDFPEPILCCYESGPTGFNLARELKAAGFDCVVAATSKLPYRCDRMKTDRVDAEWLARLLQSRAVRSVYIPTPEQEALCHLSRLRGEVACDLRRAKQRVRSFLLLMGNPYTSTKKLWTKTFYTWAGRHEFDSPADTFALRQKMAEVTHLEQVLDEVEHEILAQIAMHPRLTVLMARLMCIHGIGKVSAFSIVCEVYDFARFSRGSQFASFLGLVPSEYSSGQKVSRGDITKKGNSHLRRILIEAVNTYQRPCALKMPSDPLVPEVVRDKARKCSERIYHRKQTLIDRGLSTNKVKVALARELAEWIYHIAVMSA